MSSSNDAGNGFLSPPQLLGWPSSCDSNSILDFSHLHLGSEPLKTQNEVSVRDSVLQEINDWYDSNEDDKHLASLLSVRNATYPEEGKNRHQLTAYLQAKTGEEDLCIHSIAILLLASCYTDFHPCITTLPAAFYADRTRPRFISSLRMHAQYRQSPCSGYHPRDSSPAPARPMLCTGLSPEKRLLEELARRRGQQGNLDGKFEAIDEFMDWSDDKIRYQPRRLSDGVEFIPAARELTTSSDQDQDEPEEEPSLVHGFGSQLMGDSTFWLHHSRSQPENSA
jgi:hypothetical protein